MKKTIIIASLVLAVGFFTGCSKKASETQNQSQNAKTEQSNKSQDGVIGSIKDAMGLGKAMECTYSYKVGEQNSTSKMFIDGTKFRSENDIMGEKQISIFDGETMYNWSETDKKGFKWTKSCMEELSKSYNKEENKNGPADIATDPEEAFKDTFDTKCVSVSSIDFSIPSDVEFANQCDIMKEQFKKMEEMKKNAPANAGIPEGMNIPNQ